MNRPLGRIIFLCPDATVPFGGIKVMYEMVDALVKAGFDAYIWHASARTQMSWFANETPIFTASRLQLEKTDILVVPEMLGSSYAQTASNAKVVILNQNHFHVFRGAGLKNDWQGRYPGWPNAAAVITTSRAIRDFVDYIVGNHMPVYDVPLWINGELFKPRDKTNTIVILRRRRHEDLETLVQLLHRSSRISGWRIHTADGLHQDDLAKLFGRARIFISLSNREGLGLPPAEAMASGCYVVGFTGDGGREFMLPRFCSPVEDPNLLALVREVERVATLWDTHDSDIENKVNLARDFVLSHFSYKAFQEKAISTFTELTRNSSPARQGQEILLTHYSAIQPPSTFEKMASRVGQYLPENFRTQWRSRRSRSNA